jgi:hypothetical protein
VNLTHTDIARLTSMVLDAVDGATHAALPPATDGASCLTRAKFQVAIADGALAAIRALAQVGAHAERGDAHAAPFMGDAVGRQADAPNTVLPVPIPISTAKGE